MTGTAMCLSGLPEKHGGGDFLRAVAEAVLQLVMETDVEGGNRPLTGDWPPCPARCHLPEGPPGRAHRQRGR